MFHKYTNIKRQYLELKKSLNQKSGKIPHVDGDPNFFENPNYNFYLDDQLVSKSINPTSTYRITSDFVVETLEDIPKSTTVDSFQLVNNCATFGKDEVPLHLCYLDQKFSLLINLVKFLKNMLKEVVPIIITQLKQIESLDFSEVIEQLETVNQKTGGQTTGVVLDPYESSLKYDFSEVLEILKNTQISIEEKRKLERKEIEKSGSTTSKDLKLLIETRNKIIGIFDFDEFIKDLNELFNIKNEQFYGITNKFSLLNKYSFANKTKEILDLVFSTENTTVADILRLFNDSQQSYINLTDHFYYYRDYKETLQVVKDNLQHNISSFINILMDTLKTVSKEPSMTEFVTQFKSELDLVLSKFTEEENTESFLFGIRQTIENFTKKLQETMISSSEEVQKSIAKVTERLQQVVKDFTYEVTISLEQKLTSKVETLISEVFSIDQKYQKDTKLKEKDKEAIKSVTNLIIQKITSTFDEFKQNRNIINFEKSVDELITTIKGLEIRQDVKRLLIKSIEDFNKKVKETKKKNLKGPLDIFTQRVNETIIKNEDYGEFRKYVEQDLNKINELKKFVQCLNQLDKIIYFEKTYNVKLSVFMFATWVGYRLEKKYYYFNYYNQEQKIAVQFNKVLPVSKSNLLKNIFSPIKKIKQLEELHKQIVNSTIPIFTYDVIFYNDDDGIKKSYPDCVETVLFNICKILCYDYDSKTYDAELLPITLNPNVKKIFETYTQKTDGNQEDKDKFGIFISRMRGINYRIYTRNGNFNIMSNKDNVLNALYYLIFWQEIESSGEEVTEIDNELKVTKLQKIFNNFEITNKNKKEIKINITHNSQNYYIEILNGHSKFINAPVVFYKKVEKYAYKNLVYSFSNFRDIYKNATYPLLILNSKEILESIYNEYSSNILELKNFKHKKVIFEISKINSSIKDNFPKEFSNDVDYLDDIVSIDNAESLAKILSKSVVPMLEEYLIQCIRYDSFECAELLIEKGVNVNYKDLKNQMTPLHIASIIGRLSIVEKLLLQGASKDSKDSTNSTPLHYACVSGSFEIVELLLQSGALVNMKNVNGRTPLHGACEIGSFEIVELLLQNGALVNAKATDNLIPLHIACMTGNFEIVELLLQKDALVNAKAIDNSTPLHFACKRGSFEIVELLIQKGALVDAKAVDNSTPLHFACVTGSFEIVELLIQKDALVNTKNNIGSTPLHIACEYCNSKIVKLLIENRADVNAKNNLDKTPLHIACVSCNYGLVELLILHDANVNAKTNYDITPLHYAVQRNNFDIVKILIDARADVNAKTKTKSNGGMTPLHFACSNGNYELVQLLILHGANVNVKNNYDLTPLHYACIIGSLEIVQLLIKSGANVNATTQVYETPLHKAIEKKYFYIVKALIDADADIYIKDMFDNTPITLAAKSTREIYELFTEKDASLTPYDSLDAGDSNLYRERNSNDYSNDYSSGYRL